jgi:hypothetical protein
MTIHVLHAKPDAVLSDALSRFEVQFAYPLGPGRSFRIGHGDDYTRFYRSMGEAAVIVAEQGGEVIGCAAAAVREVLTPGGQRRRVIYVGDLKIAPGARSGMLLRRLYRAGFAWASCGGESGGATAAISVVMDGTGRLPPAYTGRAGVPPFTKLAPLAVLRWLSRNHTAHRGDGRVRITDAARGEAAFASLSGGCFAAVGGKPALRSSIDPCWLVHRDGAACGRLEDTRLAKRLWADDGTELLSAHLACFACATPPAGAAVIREALGLAADLGLGAMFLSVPPGDADALMAALPDVHCTVAPATIFGAGFDAEAGSSSWRFNSSEI